MLPGSTNIKTSEYSSAKRRIRLGIYVFLGACLSSMMSSARAEDIYTVTWESPSDGPSGSMPLGNGAYGINLWVEPNGDICFYVSGSGAWSGNARLLKLGRVRMCILPAPLSDQVPFRQTLDTRTGVATITFGEPANETRVEILVDALYPAIRVHLRSPAPCSIRAVAETWRTEPRQLLPEERVSAYGISESGNPVIVEPDTYIDALSDTVMLLHRNEQSIWTDTLQRQGMAAWLTQGQDPLLHRTFGMMLSGIAFQREDMRTLVSGQSRECLLNIYLHTAQTESAADWRAAVEDLAAKDTRPYDQALGEHTAWWKTFAERSWIRLEGKDLEHINRGYALQRYITACAGRGEFPVKFNGSLFTVDAEEKGQRFDADYRRWGGPYWFQNTRLVYWPMLAAGDTEMMLPLFRMYREMLPFAEARSQVYFNHGGAFFPETLYFWGAYANDNYGYAREDLPVGITVNRYIRHYYDGALELIMLMLAYHAYTEEDAFLEEYVLPLAEPVLRFYYEHYGTDERGKLRVYPSQALETYQDAANPMPVIAGLSSVLEGLLALPESITKEKQRLQWTQWMNLLPPLPTREEKGQMLLSAAEEIMEPPANVENPELYAVFPYRRFGLGKPGLEMARRSFQLRRVKGNTGWNQDETQAALLGLTKEARQGIDERLRHKHEGSRFPAFWGPNYDWIPDQDHGGNAMMALQSMLLQTDGKRYILFPAWPRNWDVSFRLCAPGKTVITGIYRNGKVQDLSVEPETHRDQLTVLMPQ